MEGETDPDAAMREMMGFSTFNTSGHKGKSKDAEGQAGPNSESDRSTNPIKPEYLTQGSARKNLAASGSNRTPIGNKDNRHLPKRTKMDNSSASSDPAFRPAIPASLTPASILPPKPPVTVYSKNDIRSDPMYNPDIAQQPVAAEDAGSKVDAATEDQDADRAAQMAPLQQYQRVPRPPTKWTNDRGDTVYFKPSFIEDDPWAKTRAVLAKRKELQGSGSGWI